MNTPWNSSSGATVTVAIHGINLVKKIFLNFCSLQDKDNILLQFASDLLDEVYGQTLPSMNGPFFISVFQQERQVVPQGVLSYIHSYFAFSSSLPFLLLFWILEFLFAHQHLSSQTLLSSLSISSCLKQLSPKPPPCP